MEIEREKNAKLADTSEGNNINNFNKCVMSTHILGEVQELLEQIRVRDEEAECLRKRLDSLEIEKSQMMREIDKNNERIAKLEKSQHKFVKSGEIVNDELHLSLIHI